ncbi:MAG TPA: AMP-binding protein [Acidimicrobiia bacterium]|nr:AMP-binding protein [Acidimicrobiia bacterium]
MLDWLRRHPPDRVFIETPEERWTFGETLAAVEARPVAGTEVVRPWPYFSSVIDLLAVMSKGSAVIVAEETLESSLIDPAGASSVVFTSGSSGGAKGARLTMANWAAAAESSVQHLGHGADDTWLLALPLHHVAGLSIVVRSAFSGGKVRMLPGFEPVSFANELRNEVTMASVVPTMLARVLEIEPGPFPGLRALLVGGGPIPDELLERGASAGLPVLPTYGLTETCGQVATLRPGSTLENKAHPLPGVELRIEADHRIAVRGPMVSPGYAGEPDRDPAEWFVTGDLGRLDDDGALRVTGRADLVIVSGGENIDPAVVEAAIARIHGVEACLVLGVPSDEWGMELVCLYVGEASPTRIESYLHDRLAGFMIPKRWIRVKELPRTSVGKPDRAAAAVLFGRP